MKRIRTGAVLLALACPGVFARQVPVTIACTAELRAPLTGGAMPRLIARLQHLSEEERNLLLLDAGGWCAGSPLAALDPSLMTGFVDQLRPGVMIPGRAELSAGLQAVIPAPDRAFPWTAANLILPAPSPSASPVPAPFRVLEIDGIRVLVVGLTDDQPALWCPPGALSGVTTLRAEEALRRIMPAVRATAAEIRVLVAHAPATPGGALSNLAREFPDFDLYLGACGDGAVRPPGPDGPMIARPDSDARSIVVAHLLYDTVRRSVINREVDIEPMREFYPLDPAAALLISTATDLQRARLTAPVGVDSLAGVLEQLRAHLHLDACLAAPPDPAAAPATLADLHASLPIDLRIATLHVPAAALREALLNTDRTALLLVGLTLEESGKGGLRLPDGSAPIARRRLAVGIEESLLTSRGGLFPRIRELAADPAARVEWSVPIHQLLSPSPKKKSP